MRLGEILRYDGLVGDADIDKALVSQGGLGGRIGTNLIELGAVDPDTVATALARQKGVPAARREHFEQVDKSILNLLPKHLAERHSAIPLGVTQNMGHELVVAFMDPDDIAAMNEVGFASSMRVRPSVAPEYHIIHYLERLYGVPPRRFLRSAPAPAPAPAPIPAPSRPPATRLSTLDEGWGDDSDANIVADSESLPERERARAPASRTQEAPPMLSAEAAIAAIAASTSRDEIATALVGYLMMTFGCGAVLICKQQVAAGWRGWFPGIEAHTIESISIPLAAPSMFMTAAQTAQPVRGTPPPEGDDIHHRLWQLLHCNPPVEAIVVPIAIRNRAINLVYAHSADGGPLPDSDRLHEMCSAAANAYVRLIQAKKGG